MKRPFILLELFIALALISLSVIPIVSYPLKIYKKELSNLIELQLAEVAECAFKDLLLNIESYIDIETLEPYSETPETLYTVSLGDPYKWNYTATWEVKCKLPEKEPFNKALLKATLSLTPQKKGAGIIDLPKPKPLTYKYFIAKKPPPSQGEGNEDNKTVPAVHSGGQKTP